MRSSDEHLEEALAEYNERVNELEAEGSLDDLLEAYVNRSTVLYLMDSFVASVTDTDEAIDIIGRMTSEGIHVDVGTFIKAYENRGQLMCGENNDAMIADYAEIASKLPDVSGNIRHYTVKEFVDMCIGCSEDLIDEGFFGNSMPFTDKLLKMLSTKHDAWAENHLLETYNLIGQAKNGMGLSDEAIESFTEAILSGVPLYEHDSIDDELELVFSYVFRGDIFTEKNDVESMISDHKSAVDILEKMYDENRLKDCDLLVSLHQGIATALIDKGMIPESEKHLMRVVDLDMPAMKDAIETLGIKKP